MIFMALAWSIFASEPFGVETPKPTLQKAFLLAAIDPAKQYVVAFSGLQGGKTLVGSDADYLKLYGPNPVMLPPHMRGRTPAEFWIASKNYRLARVALETFKWRTPRKIWLTDAQCRQMGLKRDDKDHFWLAPRSGTDDPCPVSLRVRTASDPDSLRATPNLVLLHADELAHWKEEAWMNAQARGIVARTQFVVTTTPKGRNFCYRDLYMPGTREVNPDPSVAVFTWTSTDNPHADKVFIERLRKKFGKDYARQELDAHFITNVGYVYDFDRARHMKDPLPSQNAEDYIARVVGVDPGYGDPYAAVLCLKDKNARWWVASELYLPSKAIVDDAYPTIKIWCDRWNVQAVYVDKRRPTDWELLRRKGIRAIPNVDVFGEEDRRTVMPMVRMIQRLFREDRIRVDADCEWFAEEAENYAFPEREEKNAGENPVDYRNHLMDAIRYAICSVDALPEDRRPRYRQGMDLTPAARDRKPKIAKIATAQEYLVAQAKRMDAAQQRQGRRWLR